MLFAIKKENNSNNVLFELDPFFAENLLDLNDNRYFPFSNSSTKKTYRYATITPIDNLYLDNELRKFYQHLVKDLQFKGATFYQYTMQSGKWIANFFNEVHPECNSILDIEYNTIYNEYIEFLVDNNITPVSYSIHSLRKDMKIKDYPCKTHYVVGFIHFYRYIYDLVYGYKENEYDKDIWDIRKLGIPFEIAESRKRYTINFSSIKQKWLKENAKSYLFYRLQHRTMASAIDDLKGINILSEYLYNCNVQINKLNELDRDIIEKFFSYLSKKGFVNTTYNRRISAIKTFFSIGNMLDLDNFPTKPLILNTDFRKIVHKLPSFFTDNELKQMNDHIEDLPIQIGRMFFILENCGMRVSDICSSPIIANGKLCIEKNSNEDYIFTYYMPKCHRYNLIPVSEIIGKVIEEAIGYSKNEFGENCKFIFASSPQDAISVETFSLHMNQMSAKNNLTKDDGSPLRIKGHTFRGTVATQYANLGISMDVIRMMLGQQKIGVLKHYITIHSDKMIEYMKPIIDESDKLIRSINNPELIEKSVEEPSLIPLPNGRCSKSISSGICNKANQCYSCKMFMPLKCHLDLYKKQLADAENNISIAELHGFDRILEMNIELKNNLIRIISELE